MRGCKTCKNFEKYDGEMIPQMICFECSRFYIDHYVRRKPKKKKVKK